ncbi:MAG: hypothetical protein KDD67_16805 [Ignavibacteriae bacterium]|nr:hypothetical protein [Ignavibacteriota bacterium]
MLKVTQPSGDYTEYDYDRNGSMTTRQQYTSTNVLTKEERFGYSSWRNLPWSYEREDPTITVGPNVWEYRYRYNAQGEREQKREWLTPAGDVTAPGYEWTYYLTSGNKKQLSVWKGMQTSESGFCGDTGTGSNVYLYPEEYLTYGGYAASLTTRPSGIVEYRIADHLGSNRVVLDNTGTVLSTTDYAPFGKPVAGSEDRKNWIDKETDAENDLGNLGVRTYDDNLGRFTSVDPMWEKFAFMNPYHYSHNSPVIRVDPDGLDDYKLTVWGFVELVKETEDENDVLFGTNEQGEILEDRSITVKKGILSKIKRGELSVKTKTGTVTYQTSNFEMIRGDSEAEALFKFLSNNSPVEWSLLQIGKKGDKGQNFISSSHDCCIERGGMSILEEKIAGGYTIRRHVHSHPNGTRAASADWVNFGDVIFYENSVDEKRKRIFEIYVPQTGFFYQYNENGIIGKAEDYEKE